MSVRVRSGIAGAVAGALAVGGIALVAAPGASSGESVPIAYHDYATTVGLPQATPVVSLDSMPAGSYVVTFSTMVVAVKHHHGTVTCNAYDAVSGGTDVITSAPIRLDEHDTVPLSMTVPVVLAAPGPIVVRCTTSGKKFTAQLRNSDLTAVSVLDVVNS